MPCTFTRLSGETGAFPLEPIPRVPHHNNVRMTGISWRVRCIGLKAASPRILMRSPMALARQVAVPIPELVPVGGIEGYRDTDRGAICGESCTVDLEYRCGMWQAEALRL